MESSSKSLSSSRNWESLESGSHRQEIFALGCRATLGFDKRNFERTAQCFVIFQQSCGCAFIILLFLFVSLDLARQT